MIKLVYCLSRRDEVPPERFYEYWSTTHAVKVRGVAERIAAVRYVQSHTVEPELNRMLQVSRGLPAPYDGITEVWWSSADSLRQAVATETGSQAMQSLIADEAGFIDFSRSRVFMTVEHEIFDLR